jgi:Family of unknown function (DUF6999)
VSPPLAGPSVWDGIRHDPSTRFDPWTLEMVLRDQQRPTRRWLYPWLRPLSRVMVGLIRLVKTVLPVPLSAHATMDAACIWFLRRFVSPDACELLMRHFVVETNLLNVIAAHSGGAVAPVSLRPRTIADLGNRAVLVHDLNVYDVLTRVRPDPTTGFRPDPGLLHVPRFDVERGRRRWLNLDIQSALCLMNIPFAACLTPAEYERAVHSMRLDDSLLALLADLTGDPLFLRWCRGRVTVRVDSGMDVPRAVYEHAVICEHAHAHLVRLSERPQWMVPAPAGGGRRRTTRPASSRRPG